MNASNNMENNNILGLDLIHLDNFTELIFRFVLNLLVVTIIVRLLYYPSSRRKDYLFSFMSISTLVFLLCFLLESVKLQLGFAFGLFAIFGILRYRTNSIPIKEMTYLFILIGLSVINALVNKKISWAELIFTNLALVALVFGLEKLWLLKHESRKIILYEKIDLIQPDKREALKQDLEKRTGLKINRLEVGRIDYLRDTVRVIIYYFESDNSINLADENDEVSGKNEGDDD